MTAIHSARAASLGSISAFALCLALARLSRSRKKFCRPSRSAGATTRSAAPRPGPPPGAKAKARAGHRPDRASAAPPQRAADPAEAPGEVASSLRVYTEKEVTDRIYAQPAGSAGNRARPRHRPAQRRRQGGAIFLRGFALDHGYDIGLTLDGMPINQMSHVHSNGYADANFLMPELLSVMEVRKGPYYAEEGTIFASVGSVHMQYVEQLREGLVSVPGGSFAWADAKVAKSWALGSGELLAALEWNSYNGPWARPDEERKINGVARWSQGTEDNGISITGMAYSNHYFATDQIPYTDVCVGADVALGHGRSDRRRQRLALQRLGALERNQQERLVARRSLLPFTTTRIFMTTSPISSPIRPASSPAREPVWRSKPSVRPSPAIWLQPPAWLEI